jgi:hypothetical protein
MTFPFEEMWKSAPFRKLEKSIARQRFERTVKTESDWQSFNEALRHYSAYCMANKEWYKPKWGSTFMSQWKRWIDGEDSTERSSVTSLAFEELPLYTTAICRLCHDVPHHWHVPESYCDYQERFLICPEAMAELRGKR